MRVDVETALAIVATAFFALAAGRISLAALWGAKTRPCSSVPSGAARHTQFHHEIERDQAT